MKSFWKITNHQDPSSREAPNSKLQTHQHAGRLKLGAWCFSGIWSLGFGILAPVLAGAEPAKPVSYYHDLMPIFKRSCTGCHHPGKLKGELDLTAFAAFQKGGKHGSAFKPGEPKDSRVVEEVSGKEPSMPKEGDPLSKTEIALIERWIQQGATNDTPSGV